MRIIFSLFLLAAGGTQSNAFAKAGDDAEQRRNVLVRGGVGAGPSSDTTTGADGRGKKNSDEVLEALPEEDALRRQLGPAPGFDQDTSFGTTCPAVTPDPFGCLAGKRGVCYYHVGSKSMTAGHFHTKCVYFSELSGVAVGSPLKGSTDKYLASCAPCGCSAIFSGDTVKVGKSAEALVCPSAVPSKERSQEPSQEPSSTPTDSCLACDGEPIFVVNPGKTSFTAHNAYAKSIGCQMASIHSPKEQSAALAAMKGSMLSPGIVFIGLEQTSFLTYTWTDGTGSFTSTRFSPNGNPNPPLVYTNWLQGDPNGIADGSSQPYVGMFNFNNANDGMWVDLFAYETREALYKCCEQEKTNPSLIGCRVLAP